MPKLNKSQRRAFARLCYFAFFQLQHVANGTRWDEWFREALTETEKEELAKLRSLTNRMSERWRELAWKLEGR